MPSESGFLCYSTDKQNIVFHIVIKDSDCLGRYMIFDNIV